MTIGRSSRVECSSRQHYDPQAAFSYIDERLEAVLGQFRKDFEKELSAENLGPKFGLYGTFLPTYQRDSPISLQPETLGSLQSSSMPKSHSNLEPVHQNSEHDSVPAKIVPAPNREQPADTDTVFEKFPEQDRALSITRSSGNSTPIYKPVKAIKPLKIRIKVCSSKTLPKENAAKLCASGLDNPSSSSLGGSSLQIGDQLDEFPSTALEKPKEEKISHEVTISAKDNPFIQYRVEQHISKRKMNLKDGDCHDVHSRQELKEKTKVVGEKLLKGKRKKMHEREGYSKKMHQESPKTLIKDDDHDFAGDLNDQYFKKELSEVPRELEQKVSTFPSLQGDGVNGDAASVSAAVCDAVNDQWVCCDECGKWRLLPHGTNTDDLPEKWTCDMQSWLPGMNLCDISQDAGEKVFKTLYPVAPVEQYDQSPVTELFNFTSQRYGWKGCKEKIDTSSRKNKKCSVEGKSLAEKSFFSKKQKHTEKGRQEFQEGCNHEGNHAEHYTTKRKRSSLQDGCRLAKKKKVQCLENPKDQTKAVTSKVERKCLLTQDRKCEEYKEGQNSQDATSFSALQVKKPDMGEVDNHLDGRVSYQQRTGKELCPELRVSEKDSNFGSSKVEICNSSHGNHRHSDSTQCNGGFGAHDSSPHPKFNGKLGVEWSPNATMSSENATSLVRRNHIRAETDLKEATDLKHSADRLMKGGYEVESTSLYLCAALKFLNSASMFEPSDILSANDEEISRSMELFTGTASLCEFCAITFERMGQMAAAALAYKCKEVAYMRVVYFMNVPMCRDRHELEQSLHNPSLVNQREQLSESSASDIRPSLVRLLDFARYVNSAMEASRKSLTLFESSNRRQNEGSCRTKDLSSVKRALNLSFHELDGLISLVRVAMEDLDL